MSTLLWVLVGILLYTSLAMALKARGLLPSSFKVSGPILTIHTKRGREFLDWLATPKRLWRAWGNFGVGIAIVIMVGSFLAVITSAYGAITQPQLTTFVRPQDALVIPGVNQFLPWDAAVDIVIGLVVGLVVHEGGHGLLCRVENIKIESMGIALFALIPLGAFVQPDEESQRDADRGGKTRMFAAGVTNNFLVTAITFALMFLLVGSLVTVVSGVAIGGVFPGSAAEDAGLERGDVLTAVDGQSVGDHDEFAAALEDADREVTVDRRDGDPVTVERSLLAARAIRGGPIEQGTAIHAVDGTEVFTRSAFEEAVSGAEVIELETDAHDDPVSLPVGAFASTTAGEGPMHDAGVPDRPMLIHSVDGEPTPTTAALIDVLDEATPGDTVEVVVYVDEDGDPWDGERRTFDVTLDEHPDRDGARIGVGGLQEGVSGIVVDDFGVDPYPADQYHALLGGSGFGDEPVTTFVQRTFAVLILPFASAIDPSLGYNFAGFNSDVTNFFEVEGPIAAGVVFALINALFWTGWVNLNLGFFNCIPSYPLDGGHILRSCVEATFSRLPFDVSQNLVGAVTTAISLTMILSILGLLFVPMLIG